MLQPEKKRVPRDESQNGARILQRVDDILSGPLSKQSQSRPRITLTYAQSLDGCLSASPGNKTRISNSECQIFTHHLRSLHDAILVGVKTVLVDDPRLNVRLVSGNDPLPLILDSKLRTPPESRILRHDHPKSIVFTTVHACPTKAARLEGAGAQVVRVASDSNGRVDLSAALKYLTERGVRSVMIEGGSQVITSVLMGRYADQLVLTIAPMILGGVHAVGTMPDIPLALRPRLNDIIVESMSGSILLHGEFTRAG